MIRLNTLLKGFASSPGDSVEIRLQKDAIALVAGSCTFFGCIWALMYLSIFGPGLTASLPAVFVAIVGSSMVISHRTKEHRYVVWAQILCIMYITTGIQWSIGGIYASGFVMAWSFIGPITSLLFFSPRATAAWFCLNVVNIAATVLLDDYLMAFEVDIPKSTQRLFFIMNLSLSGLVIFSFASYFVYGRAKVQRELEEKHAHLVASQQALVKSEKIAALGQLVAGVAHELNTPLGAIRASVGNLEGALGRALDDVPRLLHRVDDAERAGWWELVHAARSGSVVLTSREERALRRQLRRELEDHDFDDAREIADILVDIGITADLAAHLPLLRSMERAPLLRGAYAVSSAYRNTENIVLAADRAAKIVFALKTYAHPGQGAELTERALASSLDTILTLYGSLLKRGVEVVRDFQGDGRIAARHDQLNQVWTNLVHNAIQAMDYSGTLTLRMREEPSLVELSLTDDGPGIPPELQDRIFEPFFTTKPLGEGTGLGLSICRDIIDSHHGTITLDSRPGRTVFTVRLPRTAP